MTLVYSGVYQQAERGETMTATLPVENPAVRRIAAALGLTVTTDQLGKDYAAANMRQHMDVVIENRYFVGDILVERAIGRNPKNQLAVFEWTVDGKTFGGPTQAFEHVYRMLRTAR